jgi:hypothetical protein
LVQTSRVREYRNILHTVKRRKANLIGHILRRNCLLKHVIEEKMDRRIEVTGRWERRRMQLLEDLRESRGNWILKEEALDRTLWRTGYEQTAGWVNKARYYGDGMSCDYLNS